MNNYVLIFKTSIRTALERSKLIAKLLYVSKEISKATIDLEDEENILRVESRYSNQQTIINTLLQEGYHVDLLAVYGQNKHGLPTLQTI